MDPLNVSFVPPTPTVVLTDIKQLLPVNIPYLLSEIFVAILAVLGNALTLFVFVVDRKLRRLTNYYIASLALADLLVGILGVPFAILTSLGLPRSLWACLLMLSFLVVLCTISIFCLVAVSIDRYWAILYPLVYSRIMTGKMARRIILLCWCLGTVVGLLPVFGWHNEERGICLFTHIMDYDFLVFLYFFTIVGPGVLMSFFYAHIYSVVLKQLRHIASQEQKSRQEVERGLGSPSNSCLFSTMPRPSVCSSSLSAKKNIHHSFKGFSFFSSKRNSEKKSDASQLPSIGLPKSNSTVSKASSAFQISPHNSRRSSTSPLFNPQYAKASGKEIKAAKNLSIIVVFFFFCWFPLYTINCVQAFCSECPVPEELLSFTIILSHANSAINPLLYAYHMKDFRRSLEFYVLKRLGIKRFKNSHRGSPVSPHYSTVLNVNPNSSNTTRNPSPILSPYLETSSSMQFRLFTPNRHSTASSLLQMSPLAENVRKKESLQKLYFVSVENNTKRPANSTFSWPPTMLSRSLVSHQSLLDSCSSIIDNKRHFKSLEGVTGLWSPFWDREESSLADNLSASSESQFVYEFSIDKTKEDNYHNKLHLSNSAPPSPAIKIFTLKSRPNSFIKTSSHHYHRLYSIPNNKTEEKSETDANTKCSQFNKCKSEERVCN